MFINTLSGLVYEEFNELNEYCFSLPGLFGLFVELVILNSPMMGVQFPEDVNNLVLVVSSGGYIGFSPNLRAILLLILLNRPLILSRIVGALS